MEIGFVSTTGYTVTAYPVTTDIWGTCQSCFETPVRLQVVFETGDVFYTGSSGGPTLIPEGANFLPRIKEEIKHFLSLCRACRNKRKGLDIKAA